MLHFSFATIIRAISEGRRIYQNMQSFLLCYLIIIATFAIVLLINLVVRDSSGNPVAPFSTIQMIWLYIILGPPAADLSVQKASPTVMQVPPRLPSESVFNREMIMDTLVYSISWAGIVLTAFYIVLFVAGNGITATACEVTYTNGCHDFYKARSVMFICFIYMSIVAGVHCRSYRRSEWNLCGLKKTWSSKYIKGVLAIDTVGTLLFVYVPKVNFYGFKQLDISWEWSLCIVAILFWIAFGELYKFLKRHFFKPMTSTRSGYKA